MDKNDGMDGYRLVGGFLIIIALVIALVGLVMIGTNIFGGSVLLIVGGWLLLTGLKIGTPELGGIDDNYSPMHDRYPVNHDTGPKYDANCNGTGRCPDCHGTGKAGWNGITNAPNAGRCPVCLGTGVCRKCGGTGVNRY